MNNFNNAQSSIANLSQAQIDEGLRSHMLRVYNYMSAALALTGIVAWFSATSGLYVAIANTMLIYVVMFAPLGVVFYFASKINSMSASKAQSVFWVFAGLMGLSLSYIFLAYTGTAVFQAFFVTAGAFASLSLWGYTTKKDISGWGAFLIMGVIGIIIASIINIFLGSPALMFAISIIGLLVFAGLTAYDTQNIKIQYLQHAHHGDQQWLDKSAIHGALSLYLDFLNMFQFLLLFMGNQE